MRRIAIIQSQHSPPLVRERYIERRTLNKKLKNITNYPLTLMYAGAGYGKSTALSLYLHNARKETCWYSISQSDEAILPFLWKLTQSINQHYPHFGYDVQSELEKINHFMHDEQIYSLATTFINEVMQLEEEIIIMLDDYHHVINSHEIEKWILFLLEHAPINLHIVISSRKRPEWDILPKLKIQGDLLEITQFDLLLHPSEMHYLLEDIYRVKIAEDEVTKIYQLTEGWAIAFNMLVQQIEAGASITTILLNQKKSLRDLFAYLAQEVLSKQSLIIQQFLIQSSVLEEMSPEVCDDVLRIRGSEEILHGLVEQNLFIEEGERDHYRYHALFKSFLENTLERDYHPEFNQLHLRAANYFEKETDIEAALYHYQKVLAYDSISHLLNKHGLEILQTGRLQILYDLLMKIPNATKQNYPILYFFQGEIERYRSSYELAAGNYQQIIDLFPDESSENLYVVSLALEGMARIYLDTIQPDKAEQFVNQAIRLREKTSAEKEEMAKLNVLMAENLLNAGQANKAESWYERAKQLNLPLEESNLESRIYLRTGRLNKAKEMLEKQKKESTSNKEKHLPQSHRETDILLSIVEAFMGKAEESKVHASNGIQLGLSIQSPFVEACGWMRMGHAVQLIDHYEANLAIQCYETSLEIMEKINVSRGKAEPYMGLSLLYGRKREYERALENAEKALIETEKVKDRWLSALIKLSIAITEVYHHQFQEAASLLKELELEFTNCGDCYGRMVTAFWSAYISYDQADDETFKENMQIFLQEVQTEEYDFFLKQRTTFGPTDLQNIIPMLLRAKKFEIAVPYITKLMYELGLEVNLKNHPGYTLVIRTLGSLDVRIGQKQLKEQDWQRGKAKELFALFLTNHNKLLIKEEIFQCLWPELEENTANKNFKVALNALLKALEPERKAREESYFILRKGTAYGLNPDVVYELDASNFEEMMMMGLEEKDSNRAKELLAGGINLYQGEYLEDFRFKGWCIPERERLTQLFLRGSERLAQIAVRIGDFHLCMDRCEKILVIDNTWEEAYRLMMYCYYQNNNRPQAIKWYEKCFEVLEQELGVEPMESTKDMYRLIIESGDIDEY